MLYKNKYCKWHVKQLELMKEINYNNLFYGVTCTFF